MTKWFLRGVSARHVIVDVGTGVVCTSPKDNRKRLFETITELGLQWFPLGRNLESNAWDNAAIKLYRVVSITISKKPNHLRCQLNDCWQLYRTSFRSSLEESRICYIYDHLWITIIQISKISLCHPLHCPTFIVKATLNNALAINISPSEAWVSRLLINANGPRLFDAHSSH